VENKYLISSCCIVIHTIALALIAIPILILTILLPNAMLHDDSFVINNFNFENNIGLITLGLTTVFVFICLK
jgi:hypothetical protein